MKWVFHMPCMAEVILTMQRVSAASCWTQSCSHWNQQTYSSVGSKFKCSMSWTR